VRQPKRRTLLLAATTTLALGLAPDMATLGTCVGHLGPPSNTGTPHPKGPTCSLWSSCALALDTAKEGGSTHG
jgi:hypothetical protein